VPSDQPRQRFVDIVDNIEAALSYTSGMTREQFLADKKTVDASERCLSRISEAAVKLGLLAEELAPAQPWGNIRGLGNHLRHDYPNIIRETIWKIISSDLPSLRTDCQSAIQELDRRHGNDRST
jgi:uncharacterized protein with HEPN domain